MREARRSLAGLPSAPVIGETVRAWLIFLALFALLTGVVAVPAFQEVNLRVLAQRMDLGQNEAERIAAAVEALGRSRDGLDLDRLRGKSQVLEKIVRERIAENPFVRHVEVRDRSGGLLLFVARDRRAIVPSPPGEPPEAFPGSSDQIASASLMSEARSEGEVRVGVSRNSFLRQLEDLRRSLRIRLLGAAAAGVMVLAAGFLYVLYLLRKNRRLEQSRNAAERRSYVGLLASGLAHEIRNPLNAMNMNLQMLEEEIQGLPGLEGSDHMELFVSTKSEIKRLERLVNNFLAYARPTQPRFESRDLNDILGEVARFLQADFQQSDVRLSLDLQPLLPTVEVDETQFKQAIMNLLVNARQVLRAGGTVILRSRAAADGDVVVEVEDDGPGIPLEAREKIFEVFYSSRGGGTGLGLPIARQIVERHGGSIELGSGGERGSIFRIRLLRRHGRAPSDEPAAQTAS